jgi:hypothetical protein
MKILPLFIAISIFFISFNGIASNSVIKNPQVLWYSNFQTKLVKSTLSPQMLMYNNSIIIDGNESCYSYNSSNGNLNWIFNPEIPNLEFNTTPIVINGIEIIIGNTISSVSLGGNNKYNSAVFWINESDGSLLYQYNFTYNNPANKMVYASSPAKGIGGTFYVVTDGAIVGANNVFLFSIYSNNPMKTTGIGAGIVNSAPLFYNNALYLSFSVSTNNKVFYMLNPTTLANMPNSPSSLSFNNIYFYSSPIGIGNYVFFFSSIWNTTYYNPYIYVFFSSNFTFYEKIQTNEQGYIENYEYIYNNILYFTVNTTDVLYTLNLSTMAISQTNIKASAFVGSEYMLYYVYNGEIFSYDIGTKNLLWSWNGNIANIAPIVNNNLYSIENNGTLVCIGNARAHIQVNYSPYVISKHIENISIRVYYETLNNTISYAGNYSINVYSPFYNLFNESKNISLKTNVNGYANIDFTPPQVSNITIIQLNISSGMYNGLLPFNYKEIFITVYPSLVSLPILPLVYNVSTHVLSYSNGARILIYTNATQISNISINAISTNKFFSIYVEKNIKNNSAIVYVNATQNYSNIQLTEVYLNVSSPNYKNNTIVFSFAYQPYQKQVVFLSNTQSNTLNLMNLILNILFIIIIAFLILYIALFNRRKEIKEDKNVIENISGVSEIFKDSTTMPINEFKKKVIENHLARADNINKYIKMASSLNYISIDGNVVTLNISYKLSSLDWGSLYLMEGQSNSKTYAVISWLVSKGMNVLILSRIPPVKVFSKYKYPLEQAKVIWITNEEGKDNIRPKDLEKLSLAITQFIEKGNEGIIIIDQLEYLIINNSFTNVLKLLQNIKDHIATKRISLLVSINPESIDKQSYSLLLREAGDVL